MQCDSRGCFDDPTSVVGVGNDDDDDGGVQSLLRAYRCRIYASWSEACDWQDDSLPTGRRPPSGADYPLPQELGPLPPQVVRTVARYVRGGDGGEDGAESGGGDYERPVADVVAGVADVAAGLPLNPHPGSSENPQPRKSCNHRIISRLTIIFRGILLMLVEIRVVTIIHRSDSEGIISGDNLYHKFRLTTHFSL